MGADVAIVGAGYIGTCLGAVLAERGAEVIAIDWNTDHVALLSSGRCPIAEPHLAELLSTVARPGGPLRFTTDYDVIDETSTIVITIGTPIDVDGSILTDQLTGACREVARRLKVGDTVLLRSTVGPGMTRNLVVPLLESSGLREGVDFGVAYCPERSAEGVALAQLRSIPALVGGCSELGADAAAEFWRTTLGVEVERVSTVDVAEMVKLATNWWIDANVAVANELARLCAAVNADVLDVVAAVNTLPKGSGRVNVLTPSVGVGGSCLTKDPWIAWHAAQARGVRLTSIEASRAANDAMPHYAADEIRSGMVKIGVDPVSAPVAILGVAYKSNTGDLRATPVKSVVSALVERGAVVRLHDPLADPEEVEAEFGIAPTPGIEEALAGVNAIAILAAHDYYRSLDPSWMRTQAAEKCVVFDGRMYYSHGEIRRLRELGFDYRGIGRVDR